MVLKCGSPGEPAKIVTVNRAAAACCMDRFCLRGGSVRVKSFHVCVCCSGGTPTGVLAGFNVCSSRAAFTVREPGGGTVVFRSSGTQVAVEGC